MRTRLVAISLLATGIAFMPRVSFAQDSRPVQANKKAQDGSTRDLSGVWTQKRFGNSLTGEKGAEAPLTAWGEAQLKANKPAHGADQTLTDTDPVSKCFPPGVPRIYFHPFPMEVMQVPGRVVMVFEYDHFVRFIYADGRQHPADLAPTWMGDSIGHWDGDAFVVDTVGFNEKTWLDRVGHPHSDALHLTERFRRVDHDTLADDITIDDPKAYTKPWTAQLAFQLKPKWELIEFVCEDTYLNFSDYQKKIDAGPSK
jgi:hypothetical protein